ncbi:MAG: AAA+ family ATPase [Paracoccaceae bacterium]
MKCIAPALALLLTATPLSAEEKSGPLLPNDESLRALGDYAQEMMRGLAEHAAPMVEQLRTLIDDLGAYQGPERLPNGDIIIRRKPDAKPLPPSPEELDDEPGIAL